MVVMVLQVSPSLPAAHRAPLLSVGWIVLDEVAELAAVVRRQSPFRWVLVRPRRPERLVVRSLGLLPQLQPHLF